MRSREVSKRYWYVEWSDSSETWLAHWQHCCRCAYQTSKRCDNLIYKSRSYETSWDLTLRCLIGYWKGGLININTYIRNICIQRIFGKNYRNNFPTSTYPSSTSTRTVSYHYHRNRSISFSAHPYRSIRYYSMMWNKADNIKYMQCC